MAIVVAARNCRAGSAFGPPVIKQRRRRPMAACTTSRPLSMDDGRSNWPAWAPRRRNLKTPPSRHPISRDAWHDGGMNRIRLSTTVDASLLEHARSVRSGTTDAALIDEALAALLARYRSAEVDASYSAYDEHPLEEPDEWGDLASFRRAVASS